MTPQPNPAPTPAPRKTFLGRPLRLVPREPDLLVLPGEKVAAWAPDRPSAAVFEAVPFVDAFLRPRAEDAFAVPYLTDYDGDEAPSKLQHRRKLPFENCRTRTVWLDLDTKRKKWSKELRGDLAKLFAEIDAEREAIEAAFAAGLPRPRVLYPTRGGWRLVYVLAEPIPTAEMGPFIRRLMKCATKLGLPVDPQCKDPGRLMRLPNVVRDDDALETWTQPYMADGVEFFAVSPLDVRSKFPADDDEPAQRPEPLNVEPVDLDAIAPAVLERMKTRAGCELYGAGNWIVRAPESTGHAAILGRSNWIGNLVGAGLLDADTAEDELCAAVERRYADRDSNKIPGGKTTVRDGLRNGARQPLDLAEWIAEAEDLPPFRVVKGSEPAAPAAGPETDSEPELPSCPLELFPPVLGDFVRSVARTVQIAPDFPAMFALATVAAAMSHRVSTIKVGVTHEEAPALWVVACLKSGERKSAAVSLVTGPLLELERQHLAKHSAALRHYKNRKDVYDREIDKWTKEAARDGTGANSIPLARLADIEKNPPIPPTSPGLTTSDATPEAIKSMMANQNGRVFFCSSEGGIFDRLADNKQKNVDLEPLLKAHAGEPIKEHRRTSGEVVIPNAVLGLAVSLQPFVVEALLANDRFGGTGFLARMLLAFPKAMAGSRLEEDQALDPAAKARFEAALAKLYDGRTTADVVLRLEGEALAAHREFRLAIERRLAPGQDLAGDDVISWASKLAGAVARIAAVFHVAEHGLDVPRISADAVQAAAEFANRYLIPHALHAFTSAPVPQAAGESIERFLRDATTPTPNAVVAFSALWAAFESWCAEEVRSRRDEWAGFKVTERVFAHALTKLGFAKGKTPTGDKGRKGLALRAP